MRCGATVPSGVAAVAAAMTASPLAAQPGRGVAPKGPLNTLLDVRDAIRGCWKWPPMSEVRQGMALTIRLSFKRSGEIFGATLTYETRDVSDEERRTVLRRAAGGAEALLAAAGVREPRRGDRRAAVYVPIQRQPKRKKGLSFMASPENTMTLDTTKGKS